jgi:acetoin utilization deacetylase AcuC-like enzyme
LATYRADVLAVSSNIASDAHDTGPRHPERPERLVAAREGLVAAGLEAAVVEVAPRAATVEELARVHSAAYLRYGEAFCRAGGGHFDADTPAVAGSWTSALLAAGAGLAVINTLQTGAATAGMVLCRPPGHHATRERAMGFCLLNSVAVAAAALREAGERVAVIDWDVHHGNGTQDIFWDDPTVLFASMHQAPPHYPGTGAVGETGGPNAPGATINIPLPPGATGDVLLSAVDTVIAPAVAAHNTTWLLVSAGFDGHRDDPLADLALTAGDFAQLTTNVAALVPSSRVVFFLEGGYDLAALRASVGATAAAALGESYRPEAPSHGGPGSHVVAAAARAHHAAVQG